MGHRLPHASLAPLGFVLEAVKIVGECVQVRLRSRNLSAACPACGRASRRIQTRYERRPADFSLSDRRVELTVVTRRF